jgi:4-amino-4-deoxy-L-arabinose transferase-like glycosyltransferase
MLMIVVYDLIIPTEILVLYVMMNFSNFGVFFLFNMLVNSRQVGADENLQNRFNPIKWIICISYLILLVIGFIPPIGAYCRNGFNYRKLYIKLKTLNIALVFLFVFLVNFFNSLVVFYFYRRGFLRKDYLPLASSNPNDGPINNSVIGRPDSQVPLISDDTRIRCFE